MKYTQWTIKKRDIIVKNKMSRFLWFTVYMFFSITLQGTEASARLIASPVPRPCFDLWQNPLTFSQQLPYSLIFPDFPDNGRLVGWGSIRPCNDWTLRTIWGSVCHSFMEACSACWLDAVSNMLKSRTRRRRCSDKKCLTRQNSLFTSMLP